LLREEEGQQLLHAVATAAVAGGENAAAVGQRLGGQERRRGGDVCIGDMRRAAGPEEGAGGLGQLGPLLRHQLPQRRLRFGVGERGRWLLVLLVVVVGEGHLREPRLEEGEKAG
jgi:hypothetical protein